MSRHRLEAFSDGVVAILITIMVLELKVPQGTDWRALVPTVPILLTYVMSFVFLGIYWNNHHHMFAMTEHIDGRILWANLHLLFWLSLVPFATEWMGGNHFAAVPTAAYGMVLLASAIAYTMLQASIIRLQRPQSQLADAVGRDTKGKISAGLYVIAIPLAFIHPLASCAIYVAVALTWLVPDKRIESRVSARHGSSPRVRPRGLSELRTAPISPPRALGTPVDNGYYPAANSNSYCIFSVLN